MTELRSIVLDQQRQITQLFELYERAKQTQDDHKYSSGQSINQLKTSMHQVVKDLKKIAMEVHVINNGFLAFQELNDKILALQKSNEQKLDTILNKLTPSNSIWSPDVNFSMFGNMDCVTPFNLAESQV